jgi:menaquinol-cytochrome c reductase iron-sulfur subunit
MPNTTPAKKGTTTREECIDRRGIIKTVIYGIPLLISGTLSASIGNYLLGKEPARNDSWADTADISDIPVGQPCQLRFERAVMDAWKVRSEASSAWVILDNERRVTAFSPQCTHLGCAYRWQADKKLFTCPCHGSAFNIRGDVVAGPAIRPLDRYATKLEGTRLWLGPVQKSRDA